MPADTLQALIHVRDFTKGHPDIEANNHPIRHGSVVGVHNGIVSNDDELLARYGIERAEPQMTVDSEAIFALVELREHDPARAVRAPGRDGGRVARRPRRDTLYLARGRMRPLWLATAGGSLYFASTRRALAIVAAALRTRLDVREVREGRLLHVRAGRVERERRFKPDRRYREDAYLPPVRAPREAVSCLERLAALASVGAA